MTTINPSDDLPPSWLVVSTARNGVLVYEAGWRHRGADGALRTMKRRLGPAWLEPGGDGTFTRRHGRLRPGYLDEPKAIVAKERLVRDVERELAERADAEERHANAPPTASSRMPTWTGSRTSAARSPRRCSSTATSSSSPERRTAAAAASTAD